MTDSPVPNGGSVTKPEDPLKVVDLKGKAVSVETTTSTEIMEVIERLRSTAAGEKHLAVGMFIVDADGRCWVNFRMEAGSALDSVGAVTILESRVVNEYERLQNT